MENILIYSITAFFILSSTIFVINNKLPPKKNRRLHNVRRRSKGISKFKTAVSGLQDSARII
jgi:hypothetical protein